MNAENTMKLLAVKDAMKVNHQMDKNETRRFDAVVRAATMIESLPESVGELMVATLVRAMERPTEIHEKVIYLIDTIKAKYGNAAYRAAQTASVYRRAYQAQIINNAFSDEEGRELAREFAEYYHEDEARDYGIDEAIRRSIGVTAKNVIGIIEDIVSRLQGVPEDCERGAHWGVGGYFNGVLVRGDKRVSFKSFFAGGWNIQRLHIRFRLTELKAA